MGELSKNFNTKADNWSCKCGCGQCIVVPKLVNMMQKFRDRVGESVIVHCVNRCVKHNKEIGGVENSFHLRGEACDFHVDGIPSKKLHALVLSSEDIFTGGIGLYDRFVHVDIGNKRLFDNRTDKFYLKKNNGSNV